MLGLLANPVFMALVARLTAAVDLARVKIGALESQGVIGPAAIPTVADVIRSALSDWNPELRGIRILRSEAREHFVLGLADLLIQITAAQAPRQT